VQAPPATSKLSLLFVSWHQTRQSNEWCGMSIEIDSCGKSTQNDLRARANEEREDQYWAQANTTLPELVSTSGTCIPNVFQEVR
jgi:hypothetical protein